MDYKNVSQHKFTLKFLDKELEDAFKLEYDDDVKIPLRKGIVISILSWFSAIWLIYSVIPEELNWLAPLTVVYIGTYFGFIVFATYRKKYEGYYHLMGAISNAWAGVFAIYFCHQFPNGANLALPVLIFILFFGSYLVKLRWIAGALAALSYIVGYTVYISIYSDLTTNQVVMYSFVSWMTLIFAALAGRIAETNARTSFIQRRTIEAQTTIIQSEKKLLLQEVHHRVQNNLQILLSLVNLQLSFSDTKNLELSDMRNRILSMSLIHQQVKHTDEFSEIDLDNYVRALVLDLKDHFKGEQKDAIIKIEPGLSLDIDRLISLGLILNEIITNFYLHCVAEKSVVKQYCLVVSQNNDGEMVLSYSDNGIGFNQQVLDNPGDSLGLLVIDSLADQLDAKLELSNSPGANYSLKFIK